MRLGFHYHIPFCRNDDNEITSPGYLGRFIDSIAGRIDRLVCFMHSAPENERQYSDYVLQAKNVEWVDIGPWTSVPKRMLYSRCFTAPIKARVGDLDMLLLRGPSPLLPAMASTAGKLPVALLLVGDYLTGIDGLSQPRWRKEAIRAWSYWNYWQQMRVAKRSLVFVNSRELYDRFRQRVPNLVETQTTTLSDTDSYEREDTCQGRQIRLLYTGRMDRAKGLFEMVQVVGILVADGIDIVLDLVGWPETGDTILEELMQYAGKCAVRDRVLYHGFKSVGSELFSYYVHADIYLLASQRSEGFPRTIWEAMAHSLPVAATQVGSIPHFLKHQETAWLFEDTSADAIARGVRELIRNESMRKWIISQARHLAKMNTLESRSKEMVDNLESWIVGL